MQYTTVVGLEIHAQLLFRVFARSHMVGASASLDTQPALGTTILVQR